MERSSRMPLPASSRSLSQVFRDSSFIAFGFAFRVFHICVRIGALIEGYRGKGGMALS